MLFSKKVLFALITTDLFPNTLYRKCLNVPSKKGGGGRSTPPTPLSYAPVIEHYEI